MKAINWMGDNLRHNLNHLKEIFMEDGEAQTNQNIKALNEEKEKWRRLYASLAASIPKMKIELDNLRRDVEINRKNCENANKAAQISKTILHTTMRDHGEKEKEYIALINGMKSKLRELGYDGDFDRLGNKDH